MYHLYLTDTPHLSLAMKVEAVHKVLELYSTQTQLTAQQAFTAEIQLLYYIAKYIMKHTYNRLHFLSYCHLQV